MNENLDDVSARLRKSLPGSAPELSSEVVTGAATRTAPRMVNQGRRLQVAGAATLALAAVTVGTLVISPAFQQGPLFTAAGGSATATGVAEDSMSSDLRIGNWVNYEYVAGGGLPTSGGDGTVYQLQRAGSPEDVLRDAAAAFGLSGEVAKSQYFDPAYPSYVVGAEDGTGPSVMVSWTGTGNWWYSDPAANPPMVCEPGGEVIVGGDAVAPDMCTVPETPASESLAPSEAEARLQAQELFEATGLDVDAGDIRVTVDAWSTVATASLWVDGVQTAIDWSVGWSTTGLVAWASGHSIDVVDRGSYNTVSAADAVERLSDWRWYGSAGPEFQGGMSIAVDSGRAAEIDAPTSDVPVESPVEPSAPTEEPVPAPTEEPGMTEPGKGEPGVDPGVDPGATPEPLPEETLQPEPLPEPLPEPETVVVTVDEAIETLLLMWDSEGNAWLVPGFAMQSPEGWWNTVVSLVEGVIELPEPVTIEPFIDDGTTKIEE